MKTVNPRIRTRMVMKPLKVTLTDEEILADLRYPASVDRRRDSHPATGDRAAAR